MPAFAFKTWCAMPFQGKIDILAKLQMVFFPLLKCSLAGAFLLLQIPQLAAGETEIKTELRHTKVGRRMVKAYPDFFERVRDQDLVWKDGTSIPIGIIDETKPFLERLNTPTLADQFYAAYEKGPLQKPPSINQDPGRVRFEPIFLKMYGDCKKGEVEDKLTSITWLPTKSGKKLRVTTINGVAEKLTRISHELDALPARFDKYITSPAGTYNCRSIAGTKRYSVHSFGAAIDLNVKYANYWRWSKPDKNGHYQYENQIPSEIVEIFEKHGFIWGGKWYHYDSMHFEYRPELLLSE